MKFPQGEGSAVIHRKKTRPALQRRDILTVFLVSFFISIFLTENLLNSSSTQFWMVLFFLALHIAPFSSKHFFLGLFVRSLSTQLFLLVVLLLLLLSMTAFSYAGFSSLFWVWLFHALYLSHLPPSSFLERLSSEQFAELGSVHLLAFSARACSLTFLSSVSLFLTICRAVFGILSGGGWGGGSYAFLSLVIPLISAILRAHFSYFSPGFFIRLLPCFSSFWFCSF